MTLVLDRPHTRPFHPVDDATRRQFLVGLSAAAVLAACAPGSTASPAGGETVTWEDGPFGPVEVPIRPRRVVAGYTVDADFALALGLEVVGAPGAVGNPGAPLSSYHAERLAGATRVDTGAEPNVEQVAALRPDLILDTYSTDRDRYEDWAALAPTVNFAPVLYPDDYARTDWPAALTALGALFGREAEAEKALADYERAVAAARTRFDLPAGTTFAALSSFEGVGVIDAQQLVSRVAVDLGLEPSPLVAQDSAARLELSYEEIGRLEDIDVFFVGVPPGPDSLDRDLTELGPLFDSPLWDRLPAVQAGRVVQFPSELYYASPLTAPLLAEALADGLA